MSGPNLVTDPEAIAAYDEDGSWGRLSEGWPSTPYSIGKLLLCTKANVVPYGQYVVMGAIPRTGPLGYDYSRAYIRCATFELRDRLEEAHKGMFVDCLDLIKAGMRRGINP